MSRPYGYMRKSSVRNLATDISPETQEREVRALAARHGDNGDRLELLADWDISGRSQYTNKRTAYLQLVSAVEAGECSAVYSYSLSRLGRSVAELSRFFDLCDQHKVPVRLVADSVDTTSASGRLLANVLGSVAQFEAEVASERLHAMYDTKRARGEDIRTSRRYGEQRVTKDGVIKGEGENDTLILQTFRETGSYSKTARRLNELGIKPRSANAWWSSSVAVVVQRLDPSVRPRRSGRGIAASGASFILARLLRCPTCGKTLTGSRLPWPGHEERRIRYACRFAESSPHPRTTVAEHLILPAIKAEVAHLMTPEEIETHTPNGAQRIALEARRDRINDMYANGYIDRADYTKRMEAVQGDLDKIEAQRIIKNVPSIDWDWPPKTLNAVLHAIFEEIVLDPQTFQPIDYKWNVPEWRRGT